MDAKQHYIRKRRHSGFIARIAVLLLLSCASVARTASAFDQEHQVKAAFIANFIKFIEWPDLGRAGSKFVVGVYGAEGFEHSIEEVLANRSISGHPIVVEQIHSDSEIRNCRMVISGATSEERIARLARVSADSGAVLVGESDDFARNGGTIGFVVISSKIRFDINLETAKRARVSISSKLLSLAHDVYREGRS